MAIGSFCIVLHGHMVTVGGVAVHATELAAGLQRRGHEVHVFTHLGQGQPAYCLIDGVHYHRCPAF